MNKATITCPHCGGIVPLDGATNLQQQRQVQEAVKKQLAVERARLEKEVATRCTQEQHLRFLEQERKIDALLTQIEVMKRKALQGSQKTQGDVAEIDLQESLQQAFPGDEIRRLKSEGDLLHKVRSSQNRLCGSILWEVKHTQAWRSKWVERLQTDQKAQSADLAVIATTRLPAGVELVSQLDGVWVVQLMAAPRLALLLRETLYRIAEARFYYGLESRRLDGLREYLVSKRFSDKLKQMVVAHEQIRSTLRQQRSAVSKAFDWVEKKSELSLGLLQDIQLDIESILRGPHGNSKLPEISNGNGNGSKPTGKAV